MSELDFTDLYGGLDSTDLSNPVDDTTESDLGDYTQQSPTPSSSNWFDSLSNMGSNIGSGLSTLLNDATGALNGLENAASNLNTLGGQGTNTPAASTSSSQTMLLVGLGIFALIVVMA